MNAIVLIVPGSIDGRTGGYEYDRRMVSALRARGWTVAVLELSGTFPHPASDTLTRAAAFFAAIPDGAVVVVDGLAFSAMPAEIEREAGRLRFVPIVHMPLALETGLSRDEAADLEKRERRALESARRVIVTGKGTAATLEGYGVPPDRIAVIEPGTPAAPLAAGSGDGSNIHLLSVATISPGKGHDVLIRALASIAGRGWRLTCAGNVDRYPDRVAQLRALVCASGLEDRVTLTGEVDDATLEALYNSADLFVLATRHETYGMAVAEALARGIPVVSTDTGAIAELVHDEAGIVVPADNQDAFAHALASAMDTRVRARLADGARRARERLRSWDDAASTMIEILQRVGT